MGGTLLQPGQTRLALLHARLALNCELRFVHVAQLALADLANLQGSQIIFKKAIKPLVLPYERPVDAVGYILNEVIQLVLAALLFVPRRVGQWWQGKAREPDVRRSCSCFERQS